MNYTESEISKLALDQLSPDKLRRAVEAFNGFAKLIGKPWLEEMFQGVESSVLVLQVLSLWEDWSLVKGLRGSEEILKRWKSGINEAGVWAEIHVVAHLIGMRAKVELFPQVGNRVSDLRFRANSEWIYGEVSHRGISKVRKRGGEILGRAAAAAAKAIENKHGKVAILRDIEDGEIERLILWLDSLSDCEEAQLEDFAVFRAGSISNTVDQDESFIQLVSKPMLFSTCLSKPDDHTFLKGTACMCISDRSAQEMLETEAAQLPRNHPGIVFLDLSSLVGGYAEWCPLIQRRLQPCINTRISGVLLFQTWLGRDGPMTEGSLLLNPYARNPLPKAVAPLLQWMISPQHSESIAQ